MKWLLGKAENYLSYTGDCDKCLYEVVNDETVELEYYTTEELEKLIEKGSIRNAYLTDSNTYMINGREREKKNIMKDITWNRSIVVRGLYEGIGIAIVKNPSSEDSILKDAWYKKSSGKKQLEMRIEAFNKIEADNSGSIGLRIHDSLTPEMQKIANYFQTKRAKSILMKQKLLGSEQVFNICEILGELVLVGVNGRAVNNVNAEIHIPEGVTVIYGGAIQYCKKLRLASTVKELGWGGNIQLLENVNSSINIHTYAIGKMSGTGIVGNMVKINYGRFKPRESQYKNGAITRVLYERDGFNKIDDRATAGNLRLTEAMIVKDSDFEIGDGQFECCHNLKKVYTPEGKISKIGDKAFFECSALSSIDLSHCRYIGENALSHTTVDNIVDDGIVFERDVTIKSGGLDCAIRKITFLCEHATIDRNAFGNHIIGAQIECTSEEVFMRLQEIAKEKRFSGNSIKLISNK